MPCCITIDLITVFIVFLQVIQWITVISVPSVNCYRQKNKARYLDKILGTVTRLELRVFCVQLSKETSNLVADLKLTYKNKFPKRIFD